MNNFVFKIFGAPNTFDLYQGSEGEIRYFQNFDNGGKESMKLTVHRMGSGKVSYSYLRYNFLSSSGRSNSFFGMSVLFDKEYCKDIEKIFELFDVIYKNIILKNGILLTEIKNNPQAQAKYLVSTFSEAESEVKNVENNILNNLKNHFQEDILPIDSSFLVSNSMVQLNDQMGNTKFVNSLRKCSWMHISPDYSITDHPVPDHEFLKSLDDTMEEVALKRMPIIYSNASKGNNVYKEVNTCLDKINESLGKIRTWLEDEYKKPKGVNFNSYLQKQPELKVRYDKLMGIQESLKDLLKAERTPALAPVSVWQEPEDSNVQPQNPDHETQPTSIIPFWQKREFKIAMVVVGVLLFFAIIWITIPKGLDEDTDNIRPKREVVSSENNKKLEAEGNDALQNNDFDDAITNFTNAGRTDLAVNAKKKAIEYWYEQARIASDLQTRKECFEKAKEYGGYASTDNDIANVQKQIDNSAATAKKRGRQGGVPITVSPPPNDQQLQQIYIIQISSGKKTIYSKGDKFEVIAMSNGATSTVGEWQFEEGLWADKTKNPTQVEVISVPSNGQAALRYYVGNEKKAGILIKIVQ